SFCYQFHINCPPINIGKYSFCIKSGREDMAVKRNQFKQENR
ncbi:unnamed protein product, partial [marine sediment metagenome]